MLKGSPPHQADLLPPPHRNEGSLVSALKTLLFFTVLMVTLPIGLYFASKAYIFEGKAWNTAWFVCAG